MGEWCKLCERYTLQPPCTCQLLGHWWLPESNETEADGRQLWGHDVDVALQRAIERKDLDCACELCPDGEPILVRFRPADKEGKRQKCVSYSVIAETVREYRADKADDGFVSEVAEMLRRQRRSRDERSRKKLQGA